MEAGLQHVTYMVQGMTSAIANAPESLVPLMRRAGFDLLERASRQAG